MNSAKPWDEFGKFNLLPSSFHVDRRIQQLTASWTVVTCSLFIALFAVTVATVLQARRVHHTNAEIAATAVPLIELRNNVFALRKRNEERSQWCRSVEASRPDDSMLQTLAVVAVASHNAIGEIEIESIRIQLPREFPAGKTGSPPVTIPRLVILAHVGADTAQPWLDRLSSLDRIDAVSLTSQPTPDIPRGLKFTQLDSLDERNTVEVAATPVATRVLP